MPGRSQRPEVLARMHVRAAPATTFGGTRSVQSSRGALFKA